LLRRRRQMPRVPHQIAHTQLNDPEPKPFLINNSCGSPGSRSLRIQPAHGTGHDNQYRAFEAFSFFNAENRFSAGQ
ncbi:hypothetical protein, partial [Streptomyces sp. NPDC058612]|uniref:hypothetical protein n=1 Tax=Streptomyces sp. NPDC058612 TaxID=3346555 RepID=UPI003655A834